MSNLGIGVMLKILFGGEETIEAVRASLGKLTTAIALTENKLVFEFQDNSRLVVFDGGQSCCESRYMTTADELSYFVGSSLLSLEVRDGPTVTNQGEPHEIQFLLVNTTRGTFTMENHNEHNGYYGGFAIEANLEGRAGQKWGEE